MNIQFNAVAIMIALIIELSCKQPSGNDKIKATAPLVLTDTLTVGNNKRAICCQGPPSRFRCAPDKINDK